MIRVSRLCQGELGAIISEELERTVLTAPVLDVGEIDRIPTHKQDVLHVGKILRSTPTKLLDHDVFHSGEPHLAVECREIDLDSAGSGVHGEKEKGFASSEGLGLQEAEN
jgi:hypothetical protein